MYFRDKLSENNLPGSSIQFRGDKQSKTPMVCPCTTSKKKGQNRYHVGVGNWEQDKTVVTYANGSQIYSMSSERFKPGKKIGRADNKALLKVVKIAKKLIWVKK